ncbi:hypothetical protein [Streptomyces sp. NPDC005859]
MAADYAYSVSEVGPASQCEAGPTYVVAFKLHCGARAPADQPHIP